MNQKKFEAAVAAYWQVRAGQLKKQITLGKVDSGSRGAVTGGAHMDAMAALIEEIFINAGFPPESISRASAVQLPGYFRPEKKWDLVVTHKSVLVAAIEFKSHVGPSFGNNYNNRVEEAIGSATDIWTAYREGRFGTTRPWLGYLLLLEEAPKSTAPVRVSEPFFKVDPVFIGASYKQRYEIFCRRLLLERLYDAACFLTSAESTAIKVHEPAKDLSFKTFVETIQARATTLLHNP